MVSQRQLRSAYRDIRIIKNKISVQRNRAESREICFLPGFSFGIYAACPDAAASLFQRTLSQNRLAGFQKIRCFEETLASFSSGDDRRFGSAGELSD